MKPAAFAALIAAIVCFGVALAYFLRNPSSGIVDLRGKDRVEISLTDAGFKPQDITIDRGTTVTFSTTRSAQFWPASNPHPTHEVDPHFDPKHPLQPDDTWSFMFEKAGTWGYHDHVRSYYTGTIYVAE